MPIILTEPIMIAGALVAVDGTTKTYNAAFEADQVAAGKAKWAPGSPAIGGRRVPLEVVMDSAQGIRFVAPSGTVAADGALTLGTALPATFGGGLWLYLPAGAIVGGSAGWYWADMSSTTVGVVRGSQGGAALVGSASAYTGVTAEATAYTCNIATPDVGRSTILRLPTLCASGTNAKTTRLRVGGAAVLTTAISTTGQLGGVVQILLTNLGGGVVSIENANGGGTSAVIMLADIGASIAVDVTLQQATATDYVGAGPAAWIGS